LRRGLHCDPANAPLRRTVVDNRRRRAPRCRSRRGSSETRRAQTMPAAADKRVSA
jgi:hypothetical protein